MVESTHNRKEVREFEQVKKDEMEVSELVKQASVATACTEVETPKTEDKSEGKQTKITDHFKPKA